MHENEDAKAKSSRKDSDKPTRNARGRWLPGHCPNPKGRPRKQPQEYRDLADLRVFASTLVDVRANGESQLMLRDAALIHKMYDDAMKGKVSVQKFLYREFEKNATRLAAARVHYDHLVTKWIIDNPKYGNPDFEIPFEVEMEMVSLRSVLNHYYPDSYPLHDEPTDDKG